ncbi:MAG TPA: glycosyltransferase, partial [Azospirillum sp.]
QRRHLCRWDGLDALSARLARAVDEGATRQAHPWIFLGEGAGPAAELACARRYTAWRTRGVVPLPPVPVGGARERLRIGYLSADFHEHATAALIAELIERHDRARVEVVGYSYGPDDGGALRARLARGFDRFVDLGAEPHEAAARRIRADGVDILVDLKGHTQNARPEIAAFRPAPVQAHWLGYPGSMGADFIDYVIADAVTAPDALQPHFAERIVRLPGCYQPNDRTRAVAETPSRAACGLPESGFVFCCFNSPYKIGPAVFAVWMRLLATVPGGVLWLLESHPEAAGNLRREAVRHGVDPARLVFAPRLPPAHYLARCRLADLFLDTLPVGAHTTASDALWAGLPVLTVLGDAFAGRVGASLLHAVGLPELAVESLAAYEAAALRLARDPAALAALRERLAAGRDSAPLWDTDRLARALERAYAAMWAIHAAGEPPRAIDVPA